MTYRKETAVKAIRDVHGNLNSTLEDVKNDLEELANLVSELVDAVTADIQMQGEADQ
jgi:hypothetical protein